MADAAEAVGAGCLQRLQHRFDAIAQVQVGVADDGRRGPARAVQPAGRGRRQSLHELHLAHGPHLLRPGGAVHGAGFDEDRGRYVVAAVHVGGQFVEQVALVGDPLGAEVPEVVMGVADGDFRLQRLLLSERVPVIASEWHNQASIVLVDERRPRAGDNPSGRPAQS